VLCRTETGNNFSLFHDLNETEMKERKEKNKRIDWSPNDVLYIPEQGDPGKPYIYPPPNWYQTKAGADPGNPCPGNCNQPLAPKLPGKRFAILRRLWIEMLSAKQYAENVIDLVKQSQQVVEAIKPKLAEAIANPDGSNCMSVPTIQEKQKESLENQLASLKRIRSKTGEELARIKDIELELDGIKKAQDLVNGAYSASSCGGKCVDAITGPKNNPAQPTD
jgi:hypothetical protein